MQSALRCERLPRQQVHRTSSCRRRLRSITTEPLRTRGGHPFQQHHERVQPNSPPSNTNGREAKTHPTQTKSLIPCLSFAARKGASNTTIIEAQRPLTDTQAKRSAIYSSSSSASTGAGLLVSALGLSTNLPPPIFGGGGKLASALAGPP